MEIRKTQDIRIYIYIKIQYIIQNIINDILVLYKYIGGDIKNQVKGK